MSIKWPKKWETNENRNVNYFLVPGRLQIEYEIACRKNGLSVHKRLEQIIREDKEKLTKKEQRIEECEKQILYWQNKRELIENESAMIMANEHLLRKVEDRLKEMALSDKPYRWIYGMLNSLAIKYQLTFDEMNEIFCKVAREKFQNPLIREKIFFALKFVGDRARNGGLTDEQLEEIFPPKVNA